MPSPPGVSHAGLCVTGVKASSFCGGNGKESRTTLSPPSQQHGAARPPATPSSLLMADPPLPPSIRAPGFGFPTGFPPTGFPSLHCRRRLCSRVKPPKESKESFVTAAALVFRPSQLNLLPSCISQQQKGWEIWLVCPQAPLPVLCKVTHHKPLGLRTRLLALCSRQRASLPLNNKLLCLFNLNHSF